MTPDPKAPPRVVGSAALAAARASGEPCASCGRPPANAHHVVQKSSPWFGDDAVANVVLLCGSGSSRCHGAFHGSPYVDAAGRRWEQADVAAAIGRYICEDRPDVLLYVLTKLAAPSFEDPLSPAYGYLLRTYYVTPEMIGAAKARHDL